MISVEHVAHHHHCSLLIVQWIGIGLDKCLHGDHLEAHGSSASAQLFVKDRLAVLRHCLPPL